MILHISIGPVQSFVAQARRTRDLWAGSYVLSWLSGVAMLAAESEGGRIMLPRIPRPGESETEELRRPPMLQWLANEQGPGDEPPEFGSIPNVFRVQVDNEEQALSIARRVEEDLRLRWAELSGPVWKQYIQPAAAEATETSVRAIWDRQVDDFWEVSWTLQQENDEGLLTRRKWWRSHAVKDEPGDKCHIMPDYQELSGCVRARDREAQNAFWSQIRDAVGDLDLADNERLSALGVIKRFVPKIPEKTVGWPLEVSGWPSTSYLAAVRWLVEAAEHARDEADRYTAALRKLAPQNAFSHQTPAFAAFEGLVMGDLARLRWDYLRRESLRDAPLREDDDSVRETLTAKFDELCSVSFPEHGKERKLGEPPSYYCLLLADGDKLGELSGQVGPEILARALDKFGRRGPDIVQEASGKVVYAGGDDVLALLPLRGALACAEELSTAYRQCFLAAGAPEDVPATLSAAVVYAHIHAPLTRVLKEAHHSLDAHAKDANGRNSFAALVYGRAGVRLRWVQSWWDEPQASARLGQIQEDLRDPRGGLSQSLLHALSRTLLRLNDKPRWRPGDWFGLPSNLVSVDLARAEIAANREVDLGSEKLESLSEDLASLLPQCRAGSNGGSQSFGVDGLLLAAFLAGGGREDEHR